MSTNQIQGRNPARRVLACEFNDSTIIRKEGDEEMSPNMQVLRTGVLANRVLLVGTLTKVHSSQDGSSKSGEITDPSGDVSPELNDDGDIINNSHSTSKFSVNGHKEYGPKTFQFLSQFEKSDKPATYVGVVGKPSVYSPEDDDRKFVNLRPEMISEITKEQRNRALCEICSKTINRINTFQSRLQNGDAVVDEVMTGYERGDDLTRYRNGCLSAINNILHD